MERVPCFKEAWRKAEKVIDFYDQGLHFSAYDFLGHKLLDEPPVHKKTMCVQFFENKHGKTDWVDGTMFGTWVGPMAQELQTKERVLKTQQYVKHFEQLPGGQGHLGARAPGPGTPRVSRVGAGGPVRS